jgi:hypothetical protein
LIFCLPLFNEELESYKAKEIQMRTYHSLARLIYSINQDIETFRGPLKHWPSLVLLKLAAPLLSMVLHCNIEPRPRVTEQAEDILSSSRNDPWIYNSSSLFMYVSAVPGHGQAKP